MTTSKRVVTSAGTQERHALDKLPSKMLNNNVLVRVLFNPTEDTKRESGIIISGLAGTEWNDSDYMPRYGEVVDMPRKLTFMSPSNMGSRNMVEWGTEIEIEKGDTVYFGVMISANADSFIYEDELYLLIPYQRIICKERDGVVTPVNGYCLLEEIKDSYTVKGLELDFAEKVDRNKGLVTHVGKSNTYYFGEDAMDAEVEVGDEVVFSGRFFGYLENDVFASLPKNIGYAQKRWIIVKTN